MMTRPAMVALLGSALALTGCTDSAPRVDPSDGFPAVLSPDARPEVAREALVDGTVGLRDGCFILTSGHDDWAIEWPYGVTLGADRASVNIGDLGTARIGDTIVGGGGYGEQDQGCAGVVGTVSIDTVSEVRSGAGG